MNSLYRSLLLASTTAAILSHTASAASSAPPSQPTWTSFPGANTYTDHGSTNIDTSGTSSPPRLNVTRAACRAWCLSTGDLTACPKPVCGCVVFHPDSVDPAAGGADSSSGSSSPSISDADAGDIDVSDIDAGDTNTPIVTGTCWRRAKCRSGAFSKASSTYEVDVLSPQPQCAGPASERNVLYIVFDDLRPDLSAYDVPFMKGKTPFIQS